MTRTPSTGARLITAAAVLTATGTFLLYTGLHSAGTPPPAPQLPPAAKAVRSTGPATPRPLPPAPPPVPPPVPRAPQATTGPSAAPAAHPSASSGSAPHGTPSPPLRQLPPPGSGPAADPLIQQALDQASSPDLPAADERLLLGLGRTAWLAETSSYSQVRIQAATARQDGAPSRAVVRLVWAGADRAGTLLDGRPAAVHFTQNGDGSWNRTT
ncbi:hypothetical protein AB0C86_33105 [Streptomyces lavendulae]|uniref:hypothetical protein n=1 Tax=Streptomyces lavendulae TaxID=1914 RepID=UPI0033FD2B56